jgi:hypothetical protein
MAFCSLLRDRTLRLARFTRPTIPFGRSQRLIPKSGQVSQAGLVRAWKHEWFTRLDTLADFLDLRESRRGFHP